MATAADSIRACRGRPGPHHRDHGSHPSSVTFQGGQPHAKTELPDKPIPCVWTDVPTETETEPGVEAKATVPAVVELEGGGGDGGNGITSASVSFALGAPAAPSTSSPTVPPSLQAMLEHMDTRLQELFSGRANDPQEATRRGTNGRGGDIAAMAAMATAESWAETWAEEEDEWTGRPAVAERDQTGSSLRLCSEALSRRESLSLATEQRDQTGSSLRLCSEALSRWESLLLATAGQDQTGSSLRLCSEALSRWESLSYRAVEGLVHSRRASLVHSRGGILAAHREHGDSDARRALPVAPELVVSEDKEVGWETVGSGGRRVKFPLLRFTLL